MHPDAAERRNASRLGKRSRERGRSRFEFSRLRPIVRHRCSRKCSYWARMIFCKSSTTSGCCPPDSSAHRYPLSNSQGTAGRLSRPAVDPICRSHCRAVSSRHVAPPIGDSCRLPSSQKKCSWGLSASADSMTGHRLLPSYWRSGSSTPQRSAIVTNQSQPVAICAANFTLGHTPGHRHDRRNPNTALKQASLGTAVGAGVAATAKRPLLGRVPVIGLEDDQRVFSQPQTVQRRISSPIFSSTVETNSAYWRRGEGRSLYRWRQSPVPCIG